MTENEQSEPTSIQKVKALASKDLYLFGRHVIGNDYLTPEVHGELGKWITSPDRKRKRILGGVEYRGELMAVFIPRDCLKTTFITSIYPTWRLCKNPDLTALIDSEARDLSMQVLNAIKGYMEECKPLRALWGVFKADGRTWSQQAVRIGQRTDFQAKEDNIETAGIDVAKTGRHFDIIIFDDLHSERNSKTKEQIETVIEHIQLSIPLLDKDGTLIMVGTFWADDDAYQWIRELKDDNGDPLFDIFIKSAYKEDGSPYYPVRLPLETLAMRKATMSEDLFSAQYLLDPVPKTNIVLKKENIQWINATDIPKDINRFQMVDPTGDKQIRQGDYFSTVTWGFEDKLDEMGMCKLYLIDGLCGHFSVAEQIDAMVKLFLKTRPLELGIEKAAMSTLHIHLKNHLESKNILLTTRELKPAKRDKIHVRINQFVPYFNGCYVYVNKDANKDFLDEFLYEISRYATTKKGKRDDVLDSSAYIFDFMSLYPPQAIKLKPAKPNLRTTSTSWMGY